MATVIGAAARAGRVYRRFLSAARRPEARIAFFPTALDVRSKGETGESSGLQSSAPRMRCLPREEQAQADDPFSRSSRSGRHLSPGGGSGARRSYQGTKRNRCTPS